MDREPHLKSQHYEQKYYKPIWSTVPPFIPPLFFSFSSRQRLLRQFRHDGIGSPQKLELRTVRKALCMTVFVSHCYSRCVGVCVCVYQRWRKRERGCPGVVTCCGAHLFSSSLPPSLHPPPRHCLWCFSVTLC